MKAFRTIQEQVILRTFRQVSSQRGKSFEHLALASRALPKQPASRYSSSALFPLSSKQSRSPLSRKLISKRLNSTKPNFNPTPNLGSPEPSLTLSQRLRKLSREYGWSALGVYILLMAVDLPFCFIAVRWLGTDRVGHWEHIIVDRFWKLVEIPFPDIRGTRGGSAEVEAVGEPIEAYGMAHSKSNEVGVVVDHGVEEAEKRNKSAEASIWTQLALAYAIHKSFIFIRVPLTVALTPKVVRVLRGWGWNIGKRKPKAVKNSKDQASR